MRIAPAQHRAYSYKETEKPDCLPVSLCEAKKQLNKANTNAFDDLLKMYLEAATKYAEKYTGVCIMQREIDTFRDFFPSPCRSEGYYTGFNSPSSSFEIRKSPLVSVESIYYENTSGVDTLVDAETYYRTLECDYSEVLLAPSKCWPSDCARKMQSIRISFTCGLFDCSDDVCSDWKTAILNHVAALFSNRGDCSDCTCESFLPATSKMFYEMQRIMSL